MNPLELQVLVLVSRVPDRHAEATVAETLPADAMVQRLPATAGRPLKVAWPRRPASIPAARARA